jgi:hypothetical protein
VTTRSLVVDPATLHPNPVHRALVLIKRLRNEGIPAYGAIALENVEYGALTIKAPDLVTGEVEYRWTDEPPQ